MELIKSYFEFPSANGINTIKGFKICKNEGPYVGAMQISHGMVEHAERYEDFMNYMAENGFVMYAYDHLGHKMSVNNDEELGFFASKDGYKCILNDILTCTRLVKKENPNLKLILLGHSMGSFYARSFAAWYTGAIDALIISGTGGSNKLAQYGKTLIKTIKLIKGEKYRSSLVQDITFKDFLSKIENPQTKNDWLTRDKNIVNMYNNDKYCSFTFTLSGFNDLLDINVMANSPQCYFKTNKDLPIFIFSGSMDPVGYYGMGVMEVLENYQKAGCKDISIRLYEGGRHEMLNEINRKEVYEDILHWTVKHI